MAYNGFEIAMLSLGRADSLLVTKWEGGSPTRVLVDGGRRGHAEIVRAFLEAHEVARIDHVVCTHYDDDHAGGLVELIKDESIQFGRAWVHVPARHVDPERVSTALSQAEGSGKAQSAMKSLQTSDALLGTIEDRNLPLSEPFRGSRIGFMTVCGPSELFYEELLGTFEDADSIKSSELREIVTEAVLKSAAGDGSLLASPPARAENDSSVILVAVYGGDTYLFTGDAGPQALEHAKDSYEVADCTWMQLPHHGSRNNITAALVEHFAPRVAYVSASGSDDHPHRAVVNAFKEAGAQVYGTHYPSAGHLYFRVGDVPEPPDFNNAATPLWDAG